MSESLAQWRFALVVVAAELRRVQRAIQPLSQMDGALLVSSGGSFLSMTLENGSQLQMRFQGVEGQSYVFEASTNLTDWVTLSTNTAVGGIISLVETNTMAYPHRFYRARRWP